MKCYFGKRGTGKTLHLVYDLVQKMLNGMEDCFTSYDMVDSFNSLGYNFSTNYEHLAFGNLDINCLNTVIPYRKINTIDPFRLGLHCDDYSTIIVPPCSLVGVTESQRYYNSHMASYFRPEILAFYETSRQWGIDFVFDCQRPRLIVPSIRELIDEFYCCLGVKDVINRYGFCVGHIWKMLRFTEWGAVDKYLNTGNIENAELVIDKSAICLHENYDTAFCRWLHLQGRKEQDFYIEQYPTIASVEDVEKVSDKYGLKVPANYFVKPGDLKKSNTVFDYEVVF